MQILPKWAERSTRECPGPLGCARGNRAVLSETGHPNTSYEATLLPWDDVVRELLQPTPGSSFCEWKGAARYWSLVNGSQRVPGVAWSYPRIPRRGDTLELRRFLPERRHAATLGRTYAVAGRRAAEGERKPMASEFVRNTSLLRHGCDAFHLSILLSSELQFEPHAGRQLPGFRQPPSHRYGVRIKLVVVDVSSMQDSSRSAPRVHSSRMGCQPNLFGINGSPIR